MVQCPECGARNSPSSTFCVRCGQSLRAAAAAPRSRPQGGTLLDEAAELYAAGRLGDAAQACRAALDEDPSLVAARSLLGMVEEERGNFAAALAEYEAVLRLAPERTAERERADRLRAVVQRESGPVFPEEAAGAVWWRRRPVLIAAGVGLLALVVGSLALLLSHPGGPGSPGAGMPGRSGNSIAGAQAPGASAGRTMDLGVGEGPLAGRPIGNVPADQSAAQRTGDDANRAAGSGPPATGSSDLGPLPSPSSALPGGPLQSPAGGKAPVIPQATPGSGTAPQPARSTGRVSISVSDATLSPGGFPSPTASAATPPEMLPGPDYRARWGASGAPVVGGPRGSDGGGESASVGRTGGGGVTASRAGFPSAVTGGGGPAAFARGPGASATWAPVAPPAGGGGGAYPTQTAPRSGAQAPSRPAGSSRARSAEGGPGGADDLRAEAQRAWAGGRASQAEALYRSAVEAYRSEAADNPGRAGACRRAIESCQRAIDAIESR